MKKAFYSFLIAACMLLMLSMTALADWSGDGMSGGQSSAGGYGSTGASYTKTGYLVYVADTTGHKMSGTKIVFWPWNGSYDSSALLSGVKTKVGEFFNHIESDVVPWGTPLFNYDSSDVMISNEPVIKQFVVSPYGTYKSGGEFIMKERLGVTDDMFAAFEADDYYLCIEGVMWCGVYGEGWTDTCSGVFAGTSRTWGEKTTNRTNMGKYTHFFLANALYMTQPWMGLTVPSSFLSGKPYYTPDDLKYPSGRGMVAYKIGDWEGGSDLLVKVYQTNDNSVITHDKTEFVSTSKNPTIAQEADYVPIAWETSKESADTHPRNPLPWDTVRSTSTHTRSGTPSNPPTLTEEEHVIYVLYEKSPQGTGDLSNERQDWINEWELDYVGVDLAGRDQTITKGYFNYDSAARTDHSTDAGYVSGSQTDDDSSYEEVITGTVATQFQRWVANGCNWKYGGGSFSASDVVVPHYAYVSSRSIWEPNVYVSAYRCLRELGSSYSTYRDFILNILKIPEGVVHSAGTAGSSSQKRFQLSPVGIKDEYTFTGTANRSWKIHHDAIPEDGHYDHKVYQTNSDGSKTYKKDASGNDEWVCPGAEAGWTVDNTTNLWHKTADEVPAWDETKSESYDMTNPSSIVYKMTHNCYKFYPFTTSVGSLPSTSLPDSYKVLYKREQSVPSIAGTTAYQTFVGSGEAPDILTVVPEVQMKLNFTTNGWSVPQVDVYVMGELERKMHPAMIQGYRLANATLIDGWTSLASPETGDSATEAFDTVGVRDDSLIAGVTQLGTAFDVAETTAPVIQVVTMAVDVSSNVEGYDLKSTWGNSSWNPEVQHNNYLSQFLADDAITQELYIQYYKNDSTSTGLLSDYVQLVATGSGVRQSPTAVSEVPVYFKDGNVTNKVDIINAIKDAYGVNDADANTIYNNWGFDTPVGPNVSQLNAVFESSTDGNNPSRDDNGAKWYDEETIALVFKTYKTNITLFQASAEDKVDYNTLKSAASKNAIEGRVFVRIKMDDALTQFQAGSVAQPYDAKCIYWGELPHARFIVSPENSSSMRK